MDSPATPEQSAITNSNSPNVSLQIVAAEAPKATPPTGSESSTPSIRNAVPESANLALRERTPPRLHESRLAETGIFENIELEEQVSPSLSGPDEK